MRARYYSPELRRFINADIIAGAISEAITLNRYAYANGNPVSNIDPFGFSSRETYNEDYEENVENEKSENTVTWQDILNAVAVVTAAGLVVVAIIASAGTVGTALAVATASVGATSTVVGAAATVGTVGSYAVAGGVAIFAVNNTIEIITDTNIIKDKLMGGNQSLYYGVEGFLSVAGTAIIVTGVSSPGLAGNAAKPKSNAKEMHSIPNEGAPKSSIDKLYHNKPGEFQRQYYDYMGNRSLRIDFTEHSPGSGHTNPHVHFMDK